MGKENIKKEEKKVVIENKFTKEQLISSKLFRNNKDILNVLIQDNEEISIDEAQKRIEKFRKGKVI